MIAHTPGPWEHAGGLEPYAAGRPVILCPNREQERAITGSGQRVLAVLNDNFPHIADARLIAAAPDLLAALQAILSRSQGKLYTTDPLTGETFDDIARAAIAKATGGAE